MAIDCDRVMDGDEPERESFILTRHEHLNLKEEIAQSTPFIRTKEHYKKE